METMQMEKVKKLVPELRFKGFDGEWKIEKLKDISKIERGRFSPRPRNNPIYYNGEIPFVQTSDVVNSNGKIEFFTQTLNEKGLAVSKLFPKGSILITIAANIGYSGVLEIDMACPDSLIGLKPNKNIHNYFLNYFLYTQQPKMDYLAPEGAQKNINIEFLNPYKITITSLPEQQKIASFLSAVDEKIQQLTRKKELLEHYKKGVMQQLFSGKLRFKDNNGENYVDWEVKRLGEIFGVIRGNGISKEQLDENGQKKCILYGQLYTTYDEVVFNVVSRTDANEGVISKIGDLLVPSSTTTTGIDLANVTALNEEGILLGGDISILRAKFNTNNVFYAYYLSNHKKYEIAAFAQGSTIVHLSYNHFKVMRIDIPIIEEQQKIANFLSSLDFKIESTTQQITQTQTFKKGLLQKMFVAA
jgi:type I restriction enzyme S subunit